MEEELAALAIPLHGSLRVCSSLEWQRVDETGGFSYARLEEYTEGFNQLLGQGGFGSV